MRGVCMMLNIYKTIIYLGIVAFILLSIVFLLGITQSSFNLHYYTAILAFIFTCFHLGLILFRNYKRKKGVK
jgi:hypothetical protein